MMAYTVKTMSFMSDSCSMVSVMNKFKVDIILTGCGSTLLILVLVLGLFKGAELANKSDKSLVSVVVKADLKVAEKVKIAGSFNGWREQCCLQKDSASGLWLMKLKLPPGVYEYVLIIDGVTENSNTGINDGFGGSNKMLYVKELPHGQGDDNA